MGSIGKGEAYENETVMVMVGIVSKVVVVVVVAMLGLELGAGSVLNGRMEKR